MDQLKRSQHHDSFVTCIIKENPLFVAVLGTCPALAITQSLEAAIGMGVLFTFVLVCSNVLISALRKLIPEEVETPAYIVVVATFVTVVKMLCEAYVPALYTSLGVFLSLLVVNCIVLGRAEAFANKNGVLDSLLDGLGNGIGYTLALVIIALVREILGTGMLSFGNIFPFLQVNGQAFSLYILTGPLTDGKAAWDYSIPLLTQPAGGFIVFGVIMAILAAKRNAKKDKEAAAKRAAAFAAATKAQEAAAPAAPKAEGGNH
jgi:Na+-translocating ferredoxin:NAD+ oxidoreductase subunit E